MLLLSSATRILATKHPPTIPHPCMPHRIAFSNVLEHPPRQASTPTGYACVGNEHGPLAPGAALLPQYKRGAHCPRTPFHFPIFFLAGSYQGTIFRSPFFFLLVDSFFLSSFVPFCTLSCVGAVSALAASPGCAVPAAASVLGAPSADPVASALPPFAESAAAGGALGSAGASELGALPSAGAATFSAAPAVPLLPPGVTVATIPVPVPGFLVWSPPVKISTPDDVSDSGSNVGFPTREATCSTCPGPFLKNLSGFPSRPVRGRGAFCSAVIHATAFGSGCGTGAPSAFNRSFAAGTRGDSG